MTVRSGWPCIRLSYLSRVYRENVLSYHNFFQLNIKYIMDKPTLALLKCVIRWKIALTRRKDHWAKISHPFGLQKLPPWIKTPRNRANACSNSSGNCLIVSVKIPEYEKHLTPFHGTKLTKFKYDLTVKTPIAMQVKICLTLVRYSYLSYFKSFQTSDTCSLSKRCKSMTKYPAQSIKLKKKVRLL